MGPGSRDTLAQSAERKALGGPAALCLSGPAHARQHGVLSLNPHGCLCCNRARGCPLCFLAGPVPSQPVPLPVSRLPQPRGPVLGLSGGHFPRGDAAQKHLVLPVGAERRLSPLLPHPTCLTALEGRGGANGRLRRAEAEV